MVIDTRETKLLHYMKNLKFVKVSQLDVGDIHYRINGKTVFIIERKTLEDLANSIKDGRFREQKIRLQKCLSQDINIIYLIEGYIPLSLIPLGGLWYPWYTPDQTSLR